MTSTYDGKRWENLGQSLLTTFAPEIDSGSGRKVPASISHSFIRWKCVERSCVFLVEFLDSCRHWPCGLQDYSSKASSSRRVNGELHGPHQTVNSTRP